MKSILITSPHPDDAVLGCGGMMAKSIRESIQVNVVYLTDGRACYEISNIKSDLSTDDIAAKRKKEAIISCKKLGVPESNLTFLEIRDRELKKPENFEMALGKIKKILNEIKPFRIFGPIFNNRHPDHQATHDIVIQALQDHPNIEFYMYGLQKPIGKSDLKINISKVKEIKAEAMFTHEIELVYERKIYEILAMQDKEKFRLFK